MMIQAAILLQADALSVQLPWLKDLLTAILTLAIIAFLVYLARPAIAGGTSDFTIVVDEDDITFNGNFPTHMRSTVIDFLRNDCAIPGAYQIKGRWDEGRLVVIVHGSHAQPLEQRIRNFLKLNLKAPRS